MGIQRKTKSVTAVLAHLNKKDEAQSVVALVDEFQEQMNKTTVYRILERLESEGVLHSFTGTDGLMWYALCNHCTSEKHSDVHPHFQCRVCGKSECIDLTVDLPNLPNYKVDSAELLILGQCPSCQN
jgi:Fur family ferric uptake transcriptional regulator